MRKLLPAVGTFFVVAGVLSAGDAAFDGVAAAQRGSEPIWRRYAEQARDAIPIYANINRRTVDRSPAGFAKSAEDALAANMQAVKIAPFDRLNPKMPL